ncbi:MAG TPA: hypothetical protein VFJ90_04295 [Candidatus Didemnitutus sp.]|nr:hypothetical protein [Candidatus Didemnitutus sp.]
MLVRVALFAAILALPAAAVAQDAPAPEPTLYGKLMDGVYTSPGGIYRVAIPVLPELGGKVHDTENVVTFDDALNTHVSIACFPLDLSQKWEYENRGARDYLAYFYSNFVMPDFQSRFRGASTEASLFVPDLHHGTLLAFALLPGGSFFDGKARVLDAPVGDATVAKRGNLLFVENGFIFVISAELAERVTQPKTFQKTPEQENEILRDRLVTFVGRIEVLVPKPESKS